MLKILIGRKKLNLKLKILVLMRNPIWNHGRREKWKLPANAKHLIVNLENGTTDVLVTKDGHSGFSIGMTKQILNRLIECKPLTSIEDTEDVWDNTTDFGGHRGEVANYQCKRMSSLFKYVYVDGSVKYRDVNRFYGVNLDNPNASYHSGLIDRVMEEKFPITMPYFPESKPFYVYCEEFLTDRKNGDYDTVGILYIIKPDGERVEINRYFKEGEKDFVKSTLLNMKYARRCMRNGWRK